MVMLSRKRLLVYGNKPYVKSEVKLRDLNNSMYKIENTENFIINDQGYLYLIYAYGNTEDTNKIDTIIFE